ncbi:MAG: hypothetical protein NTZ33_06370 [Bacteroidetes bacterium]|nr:hypothetical protein [Bacteroidota bacterium]
MSNTVFNKTGVPLMSFGTKHFMTTTGAPKVEKRPAVSKETQKLDSKSMVGDYEISPWCDNNDFPTKANEIIRTVGVLNTGLKYTRNFTIGQGIFPVNVIGYDDKGNELLKVIEDPKLINFCEGRLVRRYMEKALRDFLKFGVANVQLIPNADASQLVGLNALNAVFNRYTVAKNGLIEKVIVSGKFPDSPGTEFEAFDLLDEYDPMADLFRRKVSGNLKGKSVVFAIKDSWSNNDYYSEPAWWSAYLAGWIDIAKVVPKFLVKAYENQISWKWHIQIPYAFWDKKFPAADYPDAEKRKTAIEEYMDLIETNLCGEENADKPIFTFFEINPNNGKVEEQWIIKPLENKLNNDQNLITSAAANSEILFSLMINPNVMGAGMPGGTYAGNQGGSNIREAFLVNIANAWLDRQNLLDPLECFLEYNGVKDVQLRFRNTILTTLDTGAGSKKTLS